MKKRIVACIAVVCTLFFRPAQVFAESKAQDFLSQERKQGALATPSETDYDYYDEQEIKNDILKEDVQENADYLYEIRDEGAVLTKYIVPSSNVENPIIVPSEMDGYQVIGLERTFEQNQRIERVVIPDGVLFIGKNTFERCRKLKTVELPDTLERIEGGCFQYSGLEDITIPGNVKEITGSVFSECENLRRVDIGEMDVKELGSSMFLDCKNLEEVILPHSLEIINSHMFSGCDSLKKAEIPNAVKIIEQGAFTDSGIEDITLPDSLEFIGAMAFYRCNSLIEFTIPENVNTIEIFGGFQTIWGEKLEKITNLSPYDYDKDVYYYPYHRGKEYEWYTTEDGNDIAEYLPANSTIYRREKTSGQNQGGGISSKPPTGSLAPNKKGSSSSGGGSSYKSTETRDSGISLTKESIYSGTWEKDGEKWKLKLENGSYASSQWAKIGEFWYLIGKDAYMMTGWQLVNGKWYYMKQNGAMISNGTTPDGHRVNENGEWIQ